MPTRTVAAISDCTMPWESTTDDNDVTRSLRSRRHVSEAVGSPSSCDVTCSQRSVSAAATAAASGSSAGAISTTRPTGVNRARTAAD
jgi:hypothetical protein